MSPTRRQAGQRKCAFCGRPGVTREHVWAEWIAEEMLQRFGKTEWHVRARGQTRVESALEAVVKRVCEPCNTTWMSAIENAAKPTLIRMMFAERTNIELTEADQRVLATWAMKTMLMADFFHSTPKIAPDVYSRFFSERHPPKNQVVIWTAAYDGRDSMSLASTIAPLTLQSNQSYGRDGILEPGKVAVPGIVCTLRAAHALFHIIHYQGYYVPVGDSPSYSEFTHRIWPATGTVFWPRLKRTLDEKGLAFLIGRAGIVRSLKPLRGL